MEPKHHPELKRKIMLIFQGVKEKAFESANSLDESE